eukprot:gene19444-biopygen8465
MAGRQTGPGHCRGGFGVGGWFCSASGPIICRDLHRVGSHSVPGRCICHVLRRLIWDCCCGGPLGRLFHGIPMHVGFCSSYSTYGRRNSAIFTSTGGVARTSCRRLVLQNSYSGACSCPNSAIPLYLGGVLRTSCGSW